MQNQNNLIVGIACAVVFLIVVGVSFFTRRTPQQPVPPTEVPLAEPTFAQGSVTMVDSLPEGKSGGGPGGGMQPGLAGSAPMGGGGGMRPSLSGASPMGGGGGGGGPRPSGFGGAEAAR